MKAATVCQMYTAAAAPSEAQPVSALDTIVRFGEKCAATQPPLAPSSRTALSLTVEFTSVRFVACQTWTPPPSKEELLLATEDEVSVRLDSYMPVAAPP